MPPYDLTEWDSMIRSIRRDDLRRRLDSQWLGRLDGLVADYRAHLRLQSPLTVADWVGVLDGQCLVFLVFGHKSARDYCFIMIDCDDCDNVMMIRVTSLPRWLQTSHEVIRL